MSKRMVIVIETSVSLIFRIYLNLYFERLFISKRDEISPPDEKY